LKHRLITNWTNFSSLASFTGISASCFAVACATLWPPALGEDGGKRITSAAAPGTVGSVLLKRGWLKSSIELEA